MDIEAVVLVDSTGVIRLWSRGAESMFGYAEAEAIGRTLDLIVPPAYRDAHWAGFKRAMASGSASAEGQVSPFPAQTASGAIVETPGRLTLVRGPRGKVVAATVVFAVD